MSSPTSTNEEVSNIIFDQTFDEISTTTNADTVETEASLFPRSFIGKAVRVKGDITGKEDILINGHIEGAIALKHNQLEVGEHGQIESNVFAKVVVVRGELRGDIYASDEVIVTKTGRVFGNISAANVTMEDGAQLKGFIDMEKHDISNVHADNQTNKPASFSNLLKKVQELTHSQNTIANKNDYAHATHHPEISLDDTISKKLLGHEPIKYVPNLAGKTVIGESIMVKGEIIADEDVTIDGIFDGVLYFKNSQLEVGPHSRIKANIFIKSLVSNGEIRGDVYASDYVVIKKSGHVYGKIFSPRFSIESGAVFKGEVEMEPQNIEQAYTDTTALTHAKESALKAAEKSEKGNGHNKKINFKS